MSVEYNGVSGEFSFTTVIEKSKFICYVNRILDENDAKLYIEKIRKEHPFSTHCCYAYIADESGNLLKFSDDGEPQGTAGMPMLDVLKKRKFYKTVAVVVRYFGGKKLGTGGLVRAYGGAVENALNNATCLHLLKAVFLSVKCDYDKYDKIFKFLTANAKVIDSKFDNDIEINFAVKSDELNGFLSAFNEIFGGKIAPNKQNEGYFAF